MVDKSLSGSSILAVSLRSDPLFLDIFSIAETEPPDAILKMAAGP
ncbi:hypothetical protein [Mesorhizobium sp. M1252]